MALVGFLLATLVAPALLSWRLRRTRAWWLAGVTLAGFGVYLLVTSGHGHPHGGRLSEVIGKALQTIYGGVMLGYAGLLLLVARAGRKSRREPPPPGPPAGAA